MPAISWLADGFSERTGIHVNVRISSKLGRLADLSELAIFRVVQESLSNVIRHSSSKVVDIRLSRRPATIELSITDRGALRAQRKTTPLPSGGVGIAGMRERMQELGGRLNVHAVNGGMTVVACLPAVERASA